MFVFRLVNEESAARLKCRCADLQQLETAASDLFQLIFKIANQTGQQGRNDYGRWPI
jgi:hypothetical protein